MYEIRILGLKLGTNTKSFHTKVTNLKKRPIHLGMAALNNILYYCFGFHDVKTIIFVDESLN